MYTVVSFFAGIGGFDLAFEAAGFDIVAQVEIDDFCTAVLERHWPQVPKWRDIKDVGAHNLPYADVFCAGFPCQDISLAGNRAGLRHGTRSGLWFELARVIGEIRPRIVLLENVAAITTAGGGGARVIADLAELGYDCRWGIIRASDAGAPHQRARWWCVAYDSRQRTRSNWQNRTIFQEFDGQSSPEDQHGKRLRSNSFNGNTMADAHRTRQSQPQGSLREFWGWAGDGDQELAHTATQRLQAADRAGQSAHPAQAGRGLVDGPVRRGDVADAKRSGSEKQGQSNRSSSKASSQYRQANQPRYADYGALKPRLGRGADGLPVRLDRPRWPAPPGPQYAWEPPRTTARREHRAQRLKALGNAVVPQVVYPVALAIREWLEMADSVTVEQVA